MENNLVKLDYNLVKLANNEAKLVNILCLLGYTRDL